MKKYISSLFTIGIVTFFLAVFLMPISINAETGDFSPMVPSITAITPSTNYVGDEIEITGQNFGDSQGTNDRVKILPDSGYFLNPKIISWSNTKIIIKLYDSSLYEFAQSFSVFHEYYDPNFSIYAQSPESAPFPVKILAASCKENSWSCNDWNMCSATGTQTRTCTKSSTCRDSDISSPLTSQSCTYTPPICIYYTYSNWSACSETKQQTRNITSRYPSNCEGGESPKTTQSCNYIPACTADTWTCGDWNSCSLSGVQNRSCRKTFDCPSVETAPPTADQYCEAPNRLTPQTPPSGADKILNQDAIIKATVKLMCLFDEQSGMQGSGTIIDSRALILTNKHVVKGTVGCLVGFINNFNDQPYFGDRQIADILKVSSTQDVAVLKLRNPNNQQLNYINITNSNSNIQLGTKINVYGYPAIFGKNITYTSGDFSGLDGSYLKTTAIIEHGNSGGGAYSNSGAFIGIPSAVVKGELNALGYILSINTINSWLGNTSNIVSDNSDNNYSRVSSVLDSIDLKKLGNLQFLVAGSKSAETQSQTLSQTQKKSTIVEPNSTDQKTNIEQNKQNIEPVKDQPIKKQSIFKRFINWISSLFH